MANQRIHSKSPARRHIVSCHRHQTCHSTESLRLHVWFAVQIDWETGNSQMDLFLCCEISISIESGGRRTADGRTDNRSIRFGSVQAWKAGVATTGFGSSKNCGGRAPGRLEETGHRLFWSAPCAILSARTIILGRRTAMPVQSKA
jgi:hypothetical protein